MEAWIVIPGELTDLNTYVNAERSSRYKAARIKKAETELCYYYCRSLPKMKRIARINCFWFTKDMKKDVDNVSFAIKFILDGLVLAKRIPNDTQQYISGSIMHIFGIDNKNPRVEVRFIYE